MDYGTQEPLRAECLRVTDWPPRGLTRPPRADAATAAPAPTPDYVTLGAGPWSPAGSQGPEQGHRG